MATGVSSNRGLVGSGGLILAAARLAIGGWVGSGGLILAAARLAIGGVVVSGGLILAAARLAMGVWLGAEVSFLQRGVLP